MIRDMVKITPDTKLTPEEDALQLERGIEYRRLLKHYTEQMLEGVPENEVGLALSGGADSVTLLWTLLELGVRPRIYTFDYPTNKNVSADTARVNRCVEFYRLPFTVAMMTEDPDELATSIKSISDSQRERIVSRPDFEVSALFATMLDVASSEGVTSLFTGMMDGAIHLLGRDYEIRGRGGQIGINECDMRRIDGADSDQHIALTEMASQRGIQLCGPHLPVAAMHPYLGIPWYLMNFPRKKAITLRPWEEEENRIGFKINVASMQTGDSGTREYFDGMLSRSMVAQAVAGKTVSSGVVYYNALKSRWVVPAPNKSAVGWFGHVTDGSPLYKKDLHMESLVVPGTGRAPLPKPAEPSEEDLFDLDSVGEEEIHLDPVTGQPDTRVDCFGSPFYLGPDGAYTKCPRARKGLCGEYHPEDPFVLAECPISANAFLLPIYQLEGTAKVTGGAAKATYLQAMQDSEKLVEKILMKPAISAES